MVTDNRFSYSVLGLGLLLGGIVVAEILATSALRGRFGVVVIANLVSSLPFIAILVAGGYWLRQNDLSTDRYPRIAGWVLAGTTFLSLFFGLIAVFTQDDWLTRLGIVRWAVAAGAGGGLLVGLFEARAIRRAITAEKTRVRNEELQRQNDRLEEFASIIAHDLRNPLNVASGHIDVSREEHDDDHLDTAASALERMEEITEETLTLARSGQVIDEPETVTLSNLAKRCWRNVATARATLEFEQSATVRADPDRVQHLFENLFRNAIEHGGPEVTVRIGALPDGFYVEDDGPGVPDDERDTVLDAGYSTTQDGTGFGLAIVKQIGDAHGWDVSVTESTDGGARFEVTGVNMVPSTSATSPNMAVTPT
jgi:signal transduction histidine kinase